MSDSPAELYDLTSPEVGARAAKPRSCVLLPVGSVEPHGPHLPLGTDTLISVEACRRAVVALAEHDVRAVIAPAIPYGVTDFAAGFPGAVGVPPEVLGPYVRAVAAAWLANGFAHVCIVNNHLEPAHDRAVREAVIDLAGASVACPLTRRWARTLSDEFKRGACHAGEYESALVLAAKGRVRDLERQGLPSIDISLSDGIKAGKHTFRAMGMDAAYAGDPARATAAHGDEQYAKLVDMIVGEVIDGLARSA